MAAFPCKALYTSRIDTHPNLIFISWMHYIPSYVRNEFKKKTGIVIDEHGNRLEEFDEYGNTVPPSTVNNNPLISNSLDPFNMWLTRKISSKNGVDNIVNKKEFKPINDYKPTGNLIYGRDLFKKIEDKFS